MLYTVKDRVSGVTVINDDGSPKTFTAREDAERFVRNICHYVNTDYYVAEVPPAAEQCSHGVWPDRALEDTARSFTCASCGATVDYW